MDNDAISQRRLQESIAESSKTLWRHYSELRRNGFSRGQALELTKTFFTVSLKCLLSKKE